MLIVRVAESRGVLPVDRHVLDLEQLAALDHFALAAFVLEADAFLMADGVDLLIQLLLAVEFIHIARIVVLVEVVQASAEADALSERAVVRLVLVLILILVSSTPELVRLDLHSACANGLGAAVIRILQRIVVIPKGAGKRGIGT